MVFADDDRQQVTDTLELPWRWVCSLVMTDPNGEQWIGTGWLVGPRTVITAGHCVYFHGRSAGWARKIDVYPGRSGADTPHVYASNDLHSVTGWTQREEPENDYGAILLPEATTLGYFGQESMDDDGLKALEVNVYGYPGDKTAGTLWGTDRKLSQVTPKRLIYDLSTYGGQSGAPVFYKDGESRTVVGIHNYGDVSGNSATRITDEVFDHIEAWKK